MKTTKRLIGIGSTSYGVILDKVLLQQMNIKENDLIEIEFKKVEWTKMPKGVYIRTEKHKKVLKIFLIKQLNLCMWIWSESRLLHSLRIK